MILSKIAKQKMEVLEKNQPDLYSTINLHEDKDIKGYIKIENVAGLIIEAVLKSGGNPAVFQSEYDAYAISNDYLNDEL